MTVYLDVKWQKTVCMKMRSAGVPECGVMKMHRVENAYLVVQIADSYTLSLSLQNTSPGLRLSYHFITWVAHTGLSRVSIKDPDLVGFDCCPHSQFC